MFSVDKIKTAVTDLASSLRAPLPRAVEAAGVAVPTRAGNLFVYEDLRGEGAPIILLHGLDLAASSYEIRPLFVALAGSRPVIAFDLPGFGLSDHQKRPYDRTLFVDAVIAVLERARREHLVTGDLVALGKSSEIVAEVAAQRPDLVRSLTLICPTGLNKRERHRGSRDATSALATIGLSKPVLGRALFVLLRSRPLVTRALRRLFAGRVDRGLERYARLALAQPGAMYAQLSVLAGAADSADPFERYERVTCPVHVIYDENGRTDYSLLPALESRSGWKATRIGPTQAMPHFERTGLTLDAMRAFWAPLDLEEARMLAASRYQRGWGVS
jgi:pimeloyl-ACP methyl ester carboxylesterase